MLYALQGYRDSIHFDDVIEWIQSLESGLIVLPEGFLRTRKDNLELITELTKNHQKAIVSGIVDNLDFEAYVFSHGEIQKVFSSQEIPTVVVEDTSIPICVRVCAKIGLPYMFPYHKVIAHPSSLNLDIILKGIDLLHGEWSGSMPNGINVPIVNSSYKKSIIMMDNREPIHEFVDGKVPYVQASFEFS